MTELDNNYKIINFVISSTYSANSAVPIFTKFRAKGISALLEGVG